MDAVGTTASWLSFAATAIGLGSLITQTSAIEERLDPYRNSRSAEHLGSWTWRQPKNSWYRLGKPIPVGPVVFAKLTDRFCGSHVVGVSRLPLERTGKASWTAVLATIHEQAPNIRGRSNTKIQRSNTNITIHVEKKGSHVINVDPISNAYVQPRSHYHSSRGSRCWQSLSTRPLTRLNSTTGVLISRTTFITLLVICNAEETYRYSSASGHRAAYGSYCGNWYVEWPLGGIATVNFASHDSHILSTDVYPPTFRVRVDKSILMMLGIITSSDSRSFQCAFPGRKSPGNWILEYQRKSFASAYGSRHLFNQMGGSIYDVDFLFARRAEGDIRSSDLELKLPSTEKSFQVSMFVPQLEVSVLEQALDYLPWTSLGWSVHRGLRDILVAFARPVMDRHRQSLASHLRLAISEKSHDLEIKGWAPGFVKNSMADLAANSVLAGRGNSGDAVRVVTDAAALLWSGEDPCGLDETRFWRQGEKHVFGEGNGQKLDVDAVIALTKVFVLEWSQDFDYKMGEELPAELLFY